MNEVELAAALYEKYPMMGMALAIEIAAFAASFLGFESAAGYPLAQKTKASE